MAEVAEMGVLMDLVWMEDSCGFEAVAAMAGNGGESGIKRECKPLKSKVVRGRASSVHHLRVGKGCR